MEKSVKETLLDSGLQLLGSRGLRRWSMRGVEDLAGVPHGTARHYFGNQQGLITAMVGHLLRLDLPRPGETPRDQVKRWIGPDLTRTRARYELLVASMHDDGLAQELVRGRDLFVSSLVQLGLPGTDARMLVAALDGYVLDAILRRYTPDEDAIDPDALIEKFLPRRSK